MIGVPPDPTTHPFRVDVTYPLAGYSETDYCLSEAEAAEVLCRHAASPLAYPVVIESRRRQGDRLSRIELTSAPTTKEDAPCVA